LKLKFSKFARNTKSGLIILTLSLLSSSCAVSVANDQKANKTSSSDTPEAKQSYPVVKVVKVTSGMLDHKLELPGELRAYQDVPIHAKVEGFISWIGVDRGSILKKGDKMITIYCPELLEKVREAQAKASSANSTYKRSLANIDAEKSKLVEVEARLNADSLTLQRLEEAAKTPGAIAQNEVDVQSQTVQADKARVASVKQEIEAAKAVAAAEVENVKAAKNIVEAEYAMRSYLTLTAPFDGVITERNVHEGSIVSVDPRRDQPGAALVRIQQRNLLRLVVAVPEGSVSGLKLGQKIPFSVPAYLGKTFYGTVARLGYALDQSTRTMPVELNAWNPTRELEPGMFATVHWQVTRPYKTLFVPFSAVAADLRGTFVNVIRNGVSNRVEVQRGLPMGQLMEIVGAVEPGELVALKASDDLKTGTKVLTKEPTEEEIAKAAKAATQGAGGD
jgi:RND family efflux transporter MFP subunit